MGGLHTDRPPRPPSLQKALDLQFFFFSFFFLQRLTRHTRPLAAAPSPKRPAHPERTAGARGAGVPRGSPRFPARGGGGGIRGPRASLMQQAGRGACVGSRASGRMPGALTLLQLIQAAGAAEGAHGGRLPAAAALHPRGRPGGLRAAGRYMAPGPGTRDPRPGLARARAQLGGPPGGGGGRSRDHNAPLPPGAAAR